MLPAALDPAERDIRPLDRGLDAGRAGGSQPATPMLTVIGKVTALCLISARTSNSRNRSANCAAPPTAVSGMSTMNSSPPKHVDLASRSRLSFGSPDLEAADLAPILAPPA